jgi:threonine synthase
MGEVPAGATIVVTVTGHGLKDPMWALKDERGKDIKPQAVANKVEAVAERLGLTKK